LWDEKLARQSSEKGNTLKASKRQRRVVVQSRTKFLLPPPLNKKHSPPLRVRGHKRCTSEAQRPQADHSGADTASGDGGVAQVAKDAAWRRRAAAIQRSSGE